MTDLSKKYRIGQLLMLKYRWAGKPKLDYVYKIKGFRDKGSLVDVVLVKVREDGKWVNIAKSRGGHEAVIYDYAFEEGDITPKQGGGRVHAFKKG